MHDVVEEAKERLETARSLVTRASTAAAETARKTGAGALVLIAEAQRRKTQIVARFYEAKAWFRGVGKKIRRRPTPPAPPPFVLGSDFMESLIQRSLDPKLHALVQLRTAVRLGCDATAQSRSEACFVQGWQPELVKAALNGASNPGFSERENLLLRYADDITRTPIDVDLQLFRQLRRHFTQDQIVEITSSICYENFRTRFRNAMGVENSTREEYSREPEGIAAVDRDESESFARS